MKRKEERKGATVEKNTRKHRVLVKTPALEVGNRPVEFELSRGGQILGVLKISRGKSLFVPFGKQKGFELNHEHLAYLFQRRGRLQDRAPDRKRRAARQPLSIATPAA